MSLKVDGVSKTTYANLIGHGGAATPITFLTRSVTPCHTFCFSSANITRPCAHYSSEMQNDPQPMEEDILSDVVPSNIVSRQVSRSREASVLQSLMTLVQPSTGVDGESEYADELVSEHDELMSDDDDAEAKVVLNCLFSSCTVMTGCHKDVAGPSPSKLAKMQQSAERKQQKQKRKVAEGKLQVRRQEMDKAKASPLANIILDSHLLVSKMSDAVKRYSYLLGQTDLFKHFVDLKVYLPRWLFFTFTE